MEAREPGDAEDSGRAAHSAHSAHATLALPATRAPRVGAIAIGAIGILVLIGWMIDAPALVHVHRDWPGMAPPTAIAFVLLGLALGLRTIASVDSSPMGARAGQALALLPMGYAMVWLLAHATGTAASMGHYSGGVTVAPVTALSLALLGGALLTSRRASAAVPQALAVSAAVIGGVGVMRFLYHSPMALYAPMALHTALGVVVAATAILTTRPDASLLTILRDPGPGGVLARRLLPLAIGSPVISGWILLNIELDVRTHVHVLVPLNALVFGGLVWWVAHLLRASDALHKADARRFRQIFESAASGTLITDAAGTILFANQSAARTFGYAVEELTAMKVEELLPAEARHRHLAHRATMESAPRRMLGGREVPGRHKEGKEVAIEIALSPLDAEEGALTIASITDVSARRAAELARAEQHERFLLLTRATLDTVWDWNLEQDALWLSDNMERAFGWPTPEVMGRKWMRDLIHPDDQARLTGERAALDDSGAQLWTTEFRFRHTDGNYRDVLARAVLLRNSEGKLSRILGTLMDMSERIAMEHQLRVRTAELERSNSELERFAQIASHDLQEPLRTISSFVQLIAKRYGDKLDENGVRYIRYAVDGSERMRALINALLAYSRVDRLDAPINSEVSLTRVLARVRADLRTAIAESNAELTSDDLPVVQGNEIQLTQVLLNVISNALKYRGSEAPRIHLSAEREEPGWKISVKDNGIGIDPQYFERIFIVFQRLHTREAYEGTGVGLAICKRIVERHGGRIWVESAPGTGSTFHFTLKPAEGEAHVDHLA